MGSTGSRNAAYAVAEELRTLAGALSDAQAIRTVAEEAAEAILGACERLLDAHASKTEHDFDTAAETAAIEIMTACSFHDLIGQRVSRLARAVDAMMAERLRLVPTAAEAGMADDETVAQDWVDAFLAKNSR